MEVYFKLKFMIFERLDEILCDRTDSVEMIRATVGIRWRGIC